MTETNTVDIDVNATGQGPRAGAGAGDGAGPELFCPQCGYSLRGIECAPRCPECGLEIDREGFARSRIPWAYRRHIGRFVAYWRTVWLATLRPRQLAIEATKPVSYGDAQRFRLLTCVVAVAPMVLLLVGLMIWYGSAGFFNLLGPAVFGDIVYGTLGRAGRVPAWSLNVIIPWEAGATLPPVVPLALFVAAVLVTGVASYWFHPKGLPVVRQNRAVALSHYACAPLFFFAVPAGSFLLMGVLQRIAVDNPGTKAYGPLITFFTFVGAIALVTMAFLFVRSTLVLLRNTTHSTLLRVSVATLVLPVLWIACTVLALVGIPWVVGFVRLVISSLRR